MSCRRGARGRSTRTPRAGVRWFRVDDVDRPAVQVADPAGDRQAQAGATTPGDAASVPNRSKTRSRSATGMPGPSSPTSSRQPVAVSRAVTRTTPPAGLCREALSSRFATSWCSRAGSARARRPGGATCTSYVTSRRLARASATACCSSSSTGTSVASSGRSPASTRARSSRSAASAASRSAWSSAVRRVPGSRAATPSTRFSSTAQSAASGVRSSWLTLATSSRRRRSTSARSSAIRLNARASSPTSSAEEALTRLV